MPTEMSSQTKGLTRSVLPHVRALEVCASAVHSIIHMSYSGLGLLI